MHISDFFKNKSLDKNLFQDPVIYFKGPEYPFIFFSLLLKQLKSSCNLNITFINNEEIDISMLKAQLDQSFLGSNIFYWLGNISDNKKNKELISYLNSYKGPHTVCFFIDDTADAKLVHEGIIVDFLCTYEQFSNLIFLWPVDKQKIVLQFIKKICEESNKLNLDQYCVFANYAILLGSRSSNFMNHWLDKILVHENSLFNLSKYFFARDTSSFFKHWDLLSKDYAPIFWTSFWSEQLYRALNFIQLREQGKNLDAKQIAYKLPFSFIQYDWKKSSIKELQYAHQYIYDIDFALKNSGSESSLDLFYAKFFSKQFAKS